MELFSEIIEFAAWLLFFYAVFSFFIKPKNVVTEEKMDKLIEEINSIVHLVEREQAGDMIYWFDAQTKQFIAQGRSMEEIVNILKIRFPKHIFLISDKEMIIGPTFQIIPITSLTE